MAKLTVEFTAKFYQTIDWPDDELDNLQYDNLLCSLYVNQGDEHEIEEITAIQKDGEEFDFK